MRGISGWEGDAAPISEIKQSEAGIHTGDEAQSMIWDGVSEPNRVRRVSP